MSHTRTLHLASAVLILHISYDRDNARVSFTGVNNTAFDEFVLVDSEFGEMANRFPKLSYFADH